jgi:uncharacterized membrane protein
LSWLGNTPRAIAHLPIRFWLYVLVAASFAATFYEASYQLVAFHEHLSWDLAIFQQGLASANHGSAPAFYESMDCGRTDRCSFLLVHPAPILFAVALPYGLSPTPFTLFAIQSAVVALAAVPLYGFTEESTGSQKRALLVAALYLVWIPTFSGAMSSFHLESLLPLELFSVFWMWWSGRYAIGSILAGLTVVTLEIGPFFMLAFGVFFLLPYLERGIHAVFRGRSLRSARRNLNETTQVSLGSRLLRAIKEPGFVASVALVVGSILAYFVLREVEIHGPWFGLPPSPASFSALGALRPNPKVAFSLSAIRYQFAYKAWFWVLMFALVAFLPLLVPRTLILVAPWVVYVFFSISTSTSLAYYRLGHHYTILVAAPLLIGFVFGLSRLERWLKSHDARSIVRSGTAARFRTPTRRQRPSNHAPMRSVAVTVGIVVALMAVNIALNPVNPYISPTLRKALGYPPLWQGPVFGYTGFTEMTRLIPPYATVLATRTLLPFVANDPFTYPAVARINVTNLPFNASSLPQFVLVDESETHPVIVNYTSVYSELYAPGVYGVRGIVPLTPIGTILLFQRGYHGVTSAFGPYGFASSREYLPGTGLVVRSGSALVADPTSPSGTGILSLSSAPPGSPIWRGPVVTLPAGSYVVQIALRAFPSASTSLNQSVVGIHIHAFGYKAPVDRIKLGQLGSENWTIFQYPLTFPYPVMGLETVGFLLNSNVRIEIGAVTISQAG